MHIVSKIYLRIQDSDNKTELEVVEIDNLLHRFKILQPINYQKETLAW